MAPKKVVNHLVKLQCLAGKATPAPPVGTALGPHGINIGDFVRQFNDATRDKGDLIIPVVISIYKDRSFSFILKSPPASVLLLNSVAQVFGDDAGQPGWSGPRSQRGRSRLRPRSRSV